MRDETLQEFTKEPAEKYVIAIEYSGRLPTGASLSSGTVTAYDMGAGATDTSVLTSTTATIATTQAKAQVRAGSAGKKYKITFTVTLDTGDILEDEVLMTIRDL